MSSADPVCPPPAQTSPPLADAGCSLSGPDIVLINIFSKNSLLSLLHHTDLLHAGGVDHGASVHHPGVEQRHGPRHHGAGHAGPAQLSTSLPQVGASDGLK